MSAKLLIALALLILLSVSGCRGEHSHQTNNLIVLDRSIGGVALREPRAAIERELGPGRVLKEGIDRSAGPTPARFALVAYRNGTLVVGYEGRKLPVIFVRTKSDEFRTASGIGVGSIQERVRKIPGIECFDGTDCQHGFAHYGPGTGFHLRGWPLDARVDEVAIGYGH